MRRISAGVLPAVTLAALRYGDACAVERAVDPLDGARINPKPSRDLANAGAPWFVQSRADSLFYIGRDRGAAETLPLALGPCMASADSFLDHRALELGEDFPSSGTSPCRRGRRCVEPLPM
jgi:hypothetical protein